MPKRKEYLYDRVTKSTEPSNSANAVHGREPVYILSAVNIQSVTRKDLEIEFEVFKLRHPAWADKSFERFLEWKAQMHETKYHVETYDTAYFLDPVTARSYAKENMADINESGAYPYVVIYSRPTDHMYAESNPCMVEIYEYDRTLDEYVHVRNPKTDEKYLYIKAKFDMLMHLPEEKPAID